MLETSGLKLFILFFLKRVFVKADIFSKECIKRAAGERTDLRHDWVKNDVTRLIMRTPPHHLCHFTGISAVKVKLRIICKQISQVGLENR